MLIHFVNFADRFIWPISARSLVWTAARLMLYAQSVCPADVLGYSRQITAEMSTAGILSRAAIQAGPQVGLAASLAPVWRSQSSIARPSGWPASSASARTAASERGNSERARRESNLDANAPSSSRQRHFRRCLCLRFARRRLSRSLTRVVLRAALCRRLASPREKHSARAADWPKGKLLACGRKDALARLARG